MSFIDPSQDLRTRPSSQNIDLARLEGKHFNPSSEDSMLRLLCLFCFATLCIWASNAQNQDNIDTREPVVRLSPEKDSPVVEGRNDYFGWAVILHEIEALNTNTDTMEDALRKLR